MNQVISVSAPSPLVSDRFDKEEKAPQGDSFVVVHTRNAAPTVSPASPEELVRVHVRPEPVSVDALIKSLDLNNSSVREGIIAFPLKWKTFLQQQGAIAFELGVSALLRVARDLNGAEATQFKAAIRMIKCCQSMETNVRLASQLRPHFEAAERRALSKETQSFLAGLLANHVVDVQVREAAAELLFRMQKPVSAMVSKKDCSPELVTLVLALKDAYESHPDLPIRNGTAQGAIQTYVDAKKAVLSAKKAKRIVDLLKADPEFQAWVARELQNRGR